MLTCNSGDVFRGKVTYAAIVDGKNDAKQFEVGVEVTEKVLGEKADSPGENVPATEIFTRLHLDSIDDGEGKRRAIARDRITGLTGVELEDDWEAENGWLRLVPDHPHSLVPKIEGQTVLLRGREYNGKHYFDLYKPRERPKAKTMADIKAAFAKPY